MALRIGDKAPDFNVNDQSGKPVKLSDFKGKKLVLYFYPKDQTPGCTAEACNLRDNYHLLQNQGYEVLGVSTDTEKSHLNFIAKQKLPFRLLADTTRKLHEAYGTWIEKSMYGRKYMGTARVTFLINEKGMLEDIIDKVDTKDHTRQIIKEHSLPQKAVSQKSATEKKIVKKVAPKKKAAKKSTSRTK
ncbi:MAG: thioredoxin-dependent thiol peroxidase [Cyclobacteriaceae bacterium]|nr:thioredoxin-dependent thiol peroxidase [Cyclobacteriaceae bacterium]